MTDETLETLGKQGSGTREGVYEAEIYKELVVCDSSSCAHVSHPRWVTKRGGLKSIPGGWRNVYVEKRENAVILSFSLVGEGRVIVTIKKPGETVWW